MKGWMQSDPATSRTATPGSWFKRTAAASKASLYRYVVLGPVFGMETLPKLDQGVHQTEGTTGPA